METSFSWVVNTCVSVTDKKNIQKYGNLSIESLEQCQIIILGGGGNTTCIRSKGLSVGCYDLLQFIRLNQLKRTFLPCSLWARLFAMKFSFWKIK